MDLYFEMIDPILICCRRESPSLTAINHEVFFIRSLCHCGKKERHKSLCGRERPHETFGRLGRRKVGSLPPDLDFFPR